MRSYDGEGGHGLVYCVLGSPSVVLRREEQAAVLGVCAAQAAPGAAVVIETHSRLISAEQRDELAGNAGLRLEGDRAGSRAGPGHPMVVSTYLAAA